jgi:hypothetical protein
LYIRFLRLELEILQVEDYEALDLRRQLQQLSGEVERIEQTQIIYEDEAEENRHGKGLQRFTADFLNQNLIYLTGLYFEVREARHQTSEHGGVADGEDNQTATVD